MEFAPRPVGRNVPLRWPCCPLAQAQDNYEIQVYGADLVAPKATMIELHSNFTFSGSKDIVDGMYPTENAWHETLEITHGWPPWFETGFYVFTSAKDQYGWQWVGDHIRPRVRVPEEFRWSRLRCRAATVKKRWKIAMI